jgi:hypothetical protein
LKYKILQEAKRMCKLQQLKAAWSINGMIFVSTGQALKPIRVQSISDLTKLIKA